MRSVVGWMLSIAVHKNVATVALGDKLAWIAWSVLAGGTDYQGRPIAA